MTEQKPEYPKRPPFFAHRLVRKMTKACAAQEIGPEACWLVSVIAHLEDAIGYRRPITYYNEQLIPIMGFGGKGAFVNARRKAVEAGFLHYEQGKKRQPAIYWTSEPAGYERISDGACDEGADRDFRPVSEPKAEDAVRFQDGNQTNAVRFQDGKPTETPPPSPQYNQDTQIQTLPHFEGADPGGSVSDLDGKDKPDPTKIKQKKPRRTYPAEFSAFWEAYPRKTDKLEADRKYPIALRRIMTDRGIDETAAHQVLLAGAQRYATVAAGLESRYTKHAATWLHHGCWDDQPPASSNGKPAKHPATPLKPPPPIRRVPR